MISREIEKEIQQENKVILTFTIRQVVCLSIAIICSVLMAVFLGLDFTIAIYPCFLVGGICFAFGWIKQDGLPMERILLKKLQTKIYGNNKRVYKTKNRYITMLNKEYRRRRQMDMQDKKVQKSLKKEARNRKRAMKKSSMKKIR